MTPEQRMAAALERLWANDPAALEQAVSQDPGAFNLAPDGTRYGSDTASRAAALRASNTRAIDAGNAGGFDPEAYVAGMSPAELNNLIEFGANLPTYEQRLAARAAADRRLTQIMPSTPPATNGMGPGGGQGANPADVTNPLAMGPGDRGTNEIPLPAGVTPLPGGPGVQDPTAPGVTNWGGANLPPGPAPIAGGGGDGGGAGPGGGGQGGVNDLGYNEAAWGQHSPYYARRFRQLTNQQTVGREAQQAAAIRAQMARDEQAANPPSAGTDWSWANLPEVQVSEGGAPAGSSWRLNPNLNIQPGVTTNREILDSLGMNNEAGNWWRSNWEQNPQGASATWWSTVSSPEQFRQIQNPQGPYGEPAADALMTQLFQPVAGGTPNVPAGYALPTRG